MLSTQKKNRLDKESMINQLALLNNINGTLTEQVRQLTDQNERLKRTVIEESTAGAKQIIENLNEEIVKLRRKVISLESENLYLQNKILEKEERPIDEQYNLESKDSSIQIIKTIEDTEIEKPVKNPESARKTRSRSGKKRKFFREKVFESKETHLDQLSPVQISEKYEIDYSTACRWKRCYCERFTDKPSRKYYSFDKMSEADLDFIRTKPVKDVAERFGVVANTVYRWHSLLCK